MTNLRYFRCVASFAALLMLVSQSFGEVDDPKAQAEATKDVATTVLEPLPVHGRTSKLIVDQVRGSHFLQSLLLDDHLSSRVFDRYLESLDAARQYFIASDIIEFEKYRYEFDDALKLGNLDIAFEVFNRYRDRNIDRFQWVLSRLKKGVDSFDLTTDESILVDRRHSTWPANSAESDSLWEQKLVNLIISYKLKDWDNEKIIDTLTKRYGNFLRRSDQLNSEDAFSEYVNAFAYIYDPHTNYFSPRNSENFQLSFRLSLEGIGALLNIDEGEDFVKVVGLVPGGPAEKGGDLQPSDRIVSVGQSESGPLIDVVGWRIDDVVDLIRGPKGTVVVLEVLAPGAEAGTSRLVSITRDEVKLEDGAAKKRVIEVTHNETLHKIGVIEIPKMYVDMEAERLGLSNYRSVTRDVKALINELKEEQIEGLIIDLRNNGGGALSEAHRLTSLFIKEGPTVQIKGTHSRPQVYLDRDKSVFWGGPLVVLVNRHSASASEIFAGAIQDYGRGLIVGNQTFGKGTVQSIIPLNRGQLKVTGAKFYRISGQSTQHEGVMPDIKYPELIDPTEIGENTIEGALPWDTIDPAKYTPLGINTDVVAKVRELHARRVAENPFFEYYEDTATYDEENRARTTLSLNIENRRASKMADEAKRLKLENQLLVALGEEPVKEFDALTDALRQATHKHREKADEMLIEAGHILLDYVSMGGSIALAPSVTQTSLAN